TPNHTPSPPDALPISCEDLLGYAAEALRGRRHAELVVDDDRDAAVAGLAAIVDSGERLSLELRYRRVDGERLQAQLQAGVALDAEGAPLLTICEIVDRRPLYEATREAEDLRTRLAHVARIGTLGEMVSGIAHEVNQPLTAIANYASAARRFLRAGTGAVDIEELAVILDKIAAQAERAGQVIRGLRSLSRRRDAVRERLEVGVLISEVARLVEFELRARGWRLQLEVEEALPAVCGDAVQIQQVLLNLIRNGLEAMAEQASGEAVEVRALRAGSGWVEIRVRDSGPGVPSEVEERLFEPFYTTKAQGMGLGLSICQSIMSAHGGELRYRRGEQGAGAEFVIRLPVAMADEQAERGAVDG
ncbi:MAG: ATP-binding protein, partial [Nevskia sp.]|nr:ATP-binding protein [Nevskia sp.]